MSNIKPNDIVSAQGLKATIDTLRNLKSNEHIDRRQDVNSVAQAMETDEEGAFAYIYPEGYLMYFKESSVYQNVEYPAGEYRYLGGNWISTQTFDGDYNSLENKPYIDNVPTTGSSNLITSGGVAEALKDAGKVQDVKLNDTTLVNEGVARLKQPDSQDLVDRILNQKREDNVVVFKENEGATFTPSVNVDGILTWTNNKGRENPDPVNIKGPQGDKGDKGDTGAVFIPAVDNEGNLSWTNDQELTNPASVNIKGEKGDNGATFTPHVTTDGTISWTNDQDLSNPSTANIKGPKGDNGATFTPTVDENGDLSWSNNQGLENPATTNIRGPKGDDGISPTITKSSIENGNENFDVLTITDINGSTTTSTFKSAASAINAVREYITYHRQEEDTSLDLSVIATKIGVLPDIIFWDFKDSDAVLSISDDSVFEHTRCLAFFITNKSGGIHELILPQEMEGWDIYDRTDDKGVASVEEIVEISMFVDFEGKQIFFRGQAK